MSDKLTGLIAATHTPFDPAGELDLAVVPKIADYLIRSGVSGAFVAGTTGESHSLTIDERLTLTRRWAEVARGTPLKVIAHVGHNCQLDAILLAHDAAKSGAHAIAALSPSFFKPASVADLIRFLAPIAKAAPELPFYYYDIPSMTNVSLPTREFVQCVRESIPNCRGVKFSNSDCVQLQECLRYADGTFDVLYGTDENLLSALALGVEGAVGSSYNFAAPIYHRIMNAFRGGRWDEARREQFDSVQLLKWLARFGYLASTKVVMRMLGIDVGAVRPPLQPLSMNAETQLRLGLEESGMWAKIRVE